MRQCMRQETVIFTSLLDNRGGYNATYLYSVVVVVSSVLVVVKKVKWRLIRMKHVIFDNYDIDKYLDIAKESMEYNGVNTSDDNDVWQWAGYLEQEDFTNTLNELESFFDDKTVMFTGAIGRWCGNHTGFDIGDFDDLFSEYTKDCDYFEIYDDNGSLYIRCSHHDGTNLFQVLTLTNKGVHTFEDWQDYTGKYANCSDGDIHKILLNRKLSHVPHVAKKVYGFTA